MELTINILGSEENYRTFDVHDFSGTEDLIEAINDFIEGREWEVVNYVGLPNMGRNLDFEELGDYLEALDNCYTVEEEEALFAWYMNGAYSSITYSDFSGAYRGTYDSVADYAADSYSEVGGEEALGRLSNYIDWESVGRDMMYGGGIYALEVPDGFVIFDNI